jgi:hypothetical protein
MNVECLVQHDSGEMPEEESQNDSDNDESLVCRRSKISRGRRIWKRLGSFDRNARLSSEIDSAVLELATDFMTKSGLVEWPLSFKSKTKRISLWCKHDEYSRNNGNCIIETYHCPLKGRCGCPCQIRVITTPTYVQVDCSGGDHTQEECHKIDNSKFLNVQQRIAVAKLVKTNPAMAATDVRRAIGRSDQEQGIRTGLIRAVRSVVNNQKRTTLAELTAGIEVTSSYASIARLGDELWFGDIIRKHNSDEEHFSDVHQVFCIGNVSAEAAGEELFLNLTTVWSILHIARGHASGWPNCASGDGTGKISRKQATMISFGINSIPAKYNTINYCVGAVENQDIYTRAWDGIEKTYFALMEQWKCCAMTYNHCGVCALVSHFRTIPEVLEHIGEDGDRQLIKKCKSDNTDLFSNFAESIGVDRLVCDAHGAGTFQISCRFMFILLIIGFCSAIPFNQGSHLKYFTKGKAVYDEYYGLLLRCSSIFNVYHKPIMYQKMIEYLRTNDSDRTADWWAKHWQVNFTLADCGIGNCTHQNHQEGNWRPVKRGTGCGAKGDERQSLGTFVSNLVPFVRSASQESEGAMIDAGRPNAFVRNPMPSKKEWDMLQALHPKCIWLSLPLDLRPSEIEEFGRLVFGILDAGNSDEPTYLKIQKRHSDSMAQWLSSGGAQEDYKTGIKESLFDNILMPTNRLLYLLDPTTKRSVESVQDDLRPHFRNYVSFMAQHQPAGRDTVAGWGLPQYLDVLDSFRLISRIKPPDEPWGDLVFKCSCKHCHVHGCCGESVLWSMFLSPSLKIPGKFAVLEPANRKKRGRPTEKRIALLQHGGQDSDARAFVDKAPPRVC